MYIKVTNRRKTPVPVFGKLISGKSSAVITVDDPKKMAVLRKLREANDILFYEVKADGSSGKYATVKTTGKTSTKTAPVEAKDADSK